MKLPKTSWQVAKSLAFSSCLLMAGPALAQDAFNHSAVHQFGGGPKPLSAPVLHDDKLYGAYDGGLIPHFSIDADGNYQEHGAIIRNNYRNSVFVLANDRLYMAFQGNPTLPSFICDITAVANCKGGIFIITPGQSDDAAPLAAGDNRIYQPTGAIAADAEGNVYFTDTGNGAGAEGIGVLWKLTADDTLTVFHSFAASGDTQALLVEGDYLYGTDALGGTQSNGSLWRLKTDGTGVVETLHSFTAEQGRPGGDLYARSALIAHEGNLYGTTTDWDVAGRHGAVFRWQLDEGSFDLLHTFTGAADGSHPVGQLSMDGAGILYGSTFHGGANDAGTVYRIVLANVGTENPAYEQIHVSNGTSSLNPIGVVWQTDTQTLYGATRNGSPGAQVYRLAEAVPFQVFLQHSSQPQVERVSSTERTLSWQVQGVPADAQCGLTAEPGHAQWTGSLTLETGPGATQQGAGAVTINGLDFVLGENTFTVECANDGESESASVTLTATEPAPYQLTQFGVNLNTTGETFVLTWSDTQARRDITTCTASSVPEGVWAETFDRVERGTIHTVPMPTTTVTTTYRFTLACTRTLDGVETGNALEASIEVQRNTPPDDSGTVARDSGGGALSPALLLLLMLTGLARYAAWKPRRQRA